MDEPGEARHGPPCALAARAGAGIAQSDGLVVLLLRDQAVVQPFIKLQILLPGARAADDDGAVNDALCLWPAAGFDPARICWIAQDIQHGVRAPEAAGVGRDAEAVQPRGDRLRADARAAIAGVPVVDLLQDGCLLRVRDEFVALVIRQLLTRPAEGRLAGDPFAFA